MPDIPQFLLAHLLFFAIGSVLAILLAALIHKLFVRAGWSKYHRVEGFAFLLALHLALLPLVLVPENAFPLKYLVNPAYTLSYSGYSINLTVVLLLPFLVIGGLVFFRYRSTLQRFEDWYLGVKN